MIFPVRASVSQLTDVVVPLQGRRGGSVQLQRRLLQDPGVRLSAGPPRTTTIVGGDTRDVLGLPGVYSKTFCSGQRLFLLSFFTRQS